jgi:hypothetical protein
MTCYDNVTSVLLLLRLCVDVAEWQSVFAYVSRCNMSVSQCVVNHIAALH